MMSGASIPDNPTPQLVMNLFSLIVLTESLNNNPGTEDEKGNWWVG
jgi:hypothetical protein